MGLDEIRVYIYRHQNTVAQYIEAHPIIYLCLAAEYKPGLCLSRRWWEHPDLDIMGIRAGHAEEDGGNGIDASGSGMECRQEEGYI